MSTVPRTRTSPTAGPVTKTKSQSVSTSTDPIADSVVMESDSALIESAASVKERLDNTLQEFSR